MTKQSLQLNPVPVNGGTIAIGHRLKAKVLEDVIEQGVTHIVTLISESEGALDVQKAVADTGLEWLWLPMENAKPPDESRTSEIRQFFSKLNALLEDGAYLYLHCSAGIHRTGMITYALLRYMAKNSAESFDILKTLRELSSQEVGLERLLWGDSFAADHARNLPQGTLTVAQFLRKNHIGCTVYAHSVGEGYQYRGKVAQVYPDGGIRLVEVETTSNEEPDFVFTPPYSINGDWQPYEDFDYGSDRISIESTPKGLIISYAYAGTVYLHTRN